MNSFCLIVNYVKLFVNGDLEFLFGILEVRGARFLIMNFRQLEFLIIKISINQLLNFKNISLLTSNIQLI